MRLKTLCAYGIAVVLVLGCVDPVDAPELAAEDFQASLTGAAEIPAVTTPATGVARFAVSLDTFLTFRLDVATIDSTTLSHIHLGGAADVGGVIVTLFTGVSACTTTAQRATPRCRAGYTGLLSQGQFRPSQLTQLPASFGDTPRARFDQLIALMRSGGVYVNVHNRADPGGHIRGQVQLE